MKLLERYRPPVCLLSLFCLLLLCAGLLMACAPSPGSSETSDRTELADPTSSEPVKETEDNDPGETTDPAAEIETLREEETTAVQTQPPVLVIPGDEPVTMPPEITDTETLPYDPVLHPGDASSYQGVMIDSVYGTGKKGAEALISNGYVQLYNSSDRDISLKGASLYYKSDGSNPYAQLVFPDTAVIPAKGYYLVRANAPEGFLSENAVLCVTHFDLEWDVYLDNKEIRLLLAPSGWSIGRDEDITTFEDAVSVFVATMEYHPSVYALYDLSRNKVAVRTAKEDYSGYHTVNLTRAATPALRKLCTRTSKGEINEVGTPRIKEVQFSQEAGIYDKSFILNLSAEKNYVIYYTLDGSDPTLTTNRNRKTYTTGIMLSDTSAVSWGPLTRSWTSPSVSTQVGAHVVKAYATNGSDSTDVFTNTYFITKDLEKYGVSILSFSMPREEIIGPRGFYNSFLLTSSITGERRRGVAIMEVFDPMGDRVGNSRAELVVSGNGSSGWGMKSLRIYLKGLNNQDAGLESDLNYDIFGGKAKDIHGQAITSFSRFLIRNSGNDCATSFIRDAYMQSTADGLRVDYMASTSTLVFLNGEFWGVYNFRERYSPEYVESHYGVGKDNVAVVESDYSQVHTNTNAPYVVSAGEDGDADPFNEMVDYLRAHDLADQRHYDHIASLMDVDSFIDMWVTRLFFVARDWPENNIKVWRNKDPEDPSGVDTKWHFVLLDLDMGLGFYDFTREGENFFWAFDSGSVCGTIMRALMRNEGFRQAFILRYYELVTTHFTPEQLSLLFEELYAERDPLMALQEGRWKERGERGVFSVSKWQSECARIRSFIQNRQPYALQHFYDYFGVSEEDLDHFSRKQVTVSFHPGRTDVTLNGEAVLNGASLQIEPGKVVTLRLQAIPKEGYMVTGITFTDRQGEVRSVEGEQVTLVVGQSGTISIHTQRLVEDPDLLKKATLVAGASYLFYLSGDGELYAWGDNRYGVLGLGSSMSVVPTPTFVMNGVAKVVTSAGNAFENNESTFATAILTTDGRLFTVGRNTSGQLGRNGKNDDPTLREVELDFRVADVSMGHDHLLVVDTQGNLWGIGSNAYGALGTTGKGGDVTQFVRIDTNVAYASAGRRSTVYVKNDGTLWGLGDNRWRKMSAEQGDHIVTPVCLLQNVAFVDSGEHQILVVDEEGQLYYAGWRSLDSFNQGGGNDPIFAPVMKNVRKADIYFGNMVILNERGEAYVYGLNTENGLGDSMVLNGKPKQVQKGVLDVAAGYGFTAYLMEDGSLLIQGSNGYGQAGNGKTGGTVYMEEAELLGKLVPSP